MAIEKLNYSFKKGCGKVMKEDYSKLQKKIMEFLGCKHRQHYYNKRRSYPNMPAHVKVGIEAIFLEFGINNPDDIWNITPISNENGNIKQTSH
jgi:hypothetical protein